MKNSQDLLTKYSLLTEKHYSYHGRGYSMIELGCFKREENPELFQKIASVFELKSNVKQVSLYINNVDYFDFFDNDDNVNIFNEDAPRLCCSNNLFNNKEVFLSTNDAISLSKFIIKEHEKIIEDMQEVISEMERVERGL